MVAQVVSRVLGLTGFPVVIRFTGDALKELAGRHGFEVEEEIPFPGLLPIRLVVARV